jgi:hypothetical protein
MRIFPIEDSKESASAEDQAPSEKTDSVEPPLSVAHIQTGRAPKITRRLLILGIAGVLIVISGFVIFRYYQINRVTNSLEPLVQNVTLRTLNDAKYEIDPERITYKELFEKIDKDKSEIDSKIIEIQIIQGRFGEDEIAASLNYAKSCQGLLRALESKAYKQLAVDSAIEWEKKARDLYIGSGYYGAYYAKKTYDEANKDFDKKSDEFYASVDDVANALAATGAARVVLAHFLSDKFIIDKDLLAKLAIRNEKDRRPTSQQHQ